VGQYWFYATASALMYLQVEAMIALCGSSLKRPEVWFFRVVGVTAAAVPVAASVDFAYAALTSSGAHVSDAMFYGGQGVNRLYLLGYDIALLRPRMRDRELLVWIFWTSLVGSSGPIVNLTLAILGHPIPSPCDIGSSICRSSSTALWCTRRSWRSWSPFSRIAEMVITKFALSKANGIAIEICVALAVAFSVKRVERWIDAIVERALFARKHATEEGLRALIHD
jgi:hypothetical protein